MKFAVIASKKDPAGLNIFNHINKNFTKIPHHLIEEDSIHAENLDKKAEFKDYDFIIFATKHQAEQHNKTLSVHAPGNWKQADFGGKAGKVCPTNSFFLKHLFQTLNKEAKKEKKENSDFQVTLECTHHGPYLNKPCCFIEIGSSIKEWQDKKAGEMIARTIKKAVETFKGKLARKPWLSCIGLGGPHYCPNFNKVQLNSKYALGHIIPDYHFPINEKMLQEAIEKTNPKPKLAILDWKGIKKADERNKTTDLLNKKNIKFIRTSHVEN